MNQYESEYRYQQGQKSASIKKIEDEYSAMKAALLSSMDSDCSDEDGFPNRDPNYCHQGPTQPMPKSDLTPLNSVSGPFMPNSTPPSNVQNSCSRLAALSNSHGKDNSLVLDSKLNLVSSKADNIKHEDVLLVRQLSSASGNSTSVFDKGRKLNVPALLIIAMPHIFLKSISSQSKCWVH